MKVALENGYGDILAWHGLSDFNESLLPKIDEKSSVMIKGEIELKFKGKSNEIITEEALILKGQKYFIEKIGDIKSHSKELATKLLKDIEDICDLNMKVKLSNNKQENLTLSGTEDVLEYLKNLKENNKECYLLKLNGEEWKSDQPFAILISKNKGNYVKIGLVEISKKETVILKIIKEENLLLKKTRKSIAIPNPNSSWSKIIWMINIWWINLTVLN